MREDRSAHWRGGWEGRWGAEESDDGDGGMVAPVVDDGYGDPVDGFEID